MRVDAEAAGGMRDGLLRALKASPSFDESIAKELSSRLKTGDFVLIKGSRGMSLENFLKALEPLDFAAKK